MTFSKNPQFEKRKMRLNLRIDNFDNRLQKSFDDHIYNTQRNFEAIEINAIKQRRI